MIFDLLKTLGLIIILMVVSNHQKAYAQKHINDAVFQEWIKHPKLSTIKYYLLLNPNAPCMACHKNQLENILNNKSIYKKICVVTYADIFNFVPVFDHKKINFIIKDKSAFNKLNYLHYRNCLIKYDKGKLHLILKLTPSNADSVLYLITAS